MIVEVEAEIDEVKLAWHNLASDWDADRTHHLKDVYELLARELVLPVSAITLLGSQARP